jgi:23S rRNA (guanosine2251-2'-O)-methyltransferase
MIITGRQPVLEALKAGTPIQKIVLLAGSQGRVIDDLRKLARDRNVRCEEADRRAFGEIAPDAVTQGVVAIVPSRNQPSLEDLMETVTRRQEPGFLLVCDEIEDPQNLGALVRTAECAGAHGIIVPRHHSAPISSTVVKASAGATEHLPIAEVTNVTRALESLKEAGYWVVGLAGEGDRVYTEIDYTGPIAVVVGNEGRGIRRLVREQCDFLARIPLHGRIASLNASVAGALVLFEAARQRATSGK